MLKALIMLALICAIATPAISKKGEGADHGNKDLEQWWKDFPQSEHQMIYDRHETCKSFPEEKQKRLHKHW
jgi:hypothetical protein